MSLINSSIRSFAGLNSSIRSFAGLKSSMAQRRKTKPLVWQGNIGKKVGDEYQADPNSGKMGAKEKSQLDHEELGREAWEEHDDRFRNGLSEGWWVGIQEGNGEELKILQYLNIENADVRKPKRIIRHPVESGTTISDHMCRDPWQATVHATVCLDFYRGADGQNRINPLYEIETKLRDAYNNRKTDKGIGFILGSAADNGSVIITDEQGSPITFQLADYSSRISKDKIGLYEYTLHLQELWVVKKNMNSTSSPENADTVTK